VRFRVCAVRAVAIEVSLVLATAQCVRRDRPTTVAQSFAVDPQPIQVVEGSAPDGTPNFGLVAGATRLADGTVVVGDQSSSSLKFFDSQGRLVQSVGRPGSGPGEFGILRTVTQCAPDSLFASDGAHGVSVFSASGAFVRQFPLPQYAALAACSREATLAVLKIAEVEQPRAGVEVWRMRAPLVLADRRGAMTHDLGSVSLFDIHTSGNGWLPRPGGPQATFAVGHERVVVCPTDEGSVGTYSLEGKPLRPFPLDVPLRAPSQTFVERFPDRFLAGLPMALRARFRERFLQIPPAEHLPPCSKILMDPDDNVWVVLSVLGDSVTRLRIFGPDDRVLGDVTVPAELDVLEIGSDYLLGSGENAEGEPWVRVYRVRRTPKP